jgi:hypothetical protein
MAFARAQLDLNSSSFTGNAATNNGGGIYAIASMLALEGVRLTGNQAEVGGGIYATSRVDAIQADDYASQLLSQNLASLLTCRACVLEENRAVKGGAFALMGSTAKVTSPFVCMYTYHGVFHVLVIVVSSSPITVMDKTVTVSDLRLGGYFFLAS